MSFLDLLPGLLVALWGLLLFGALERWFDAVPRRLAAVFLALVLVLFGQTLFLGKVLLPVDNLRSTVPFQNLPAAPTAGNPLQTEQVTLIAPLAAAVRGDLADGRWPLWEPHSGAGLPLLGVPQAASLSPFRLATLPLALERAAGAAAALQVLFALVFGWLWIRRAGASSGAAAVGALAYALGGFVLLWLDWPRGGAAALIPLLLYAVERVLALGLRRDLFLLVAATLALVLAGDGEVALWGGLAALLFGATRLAQQPPWRRPSLMLRTAAAMGLALFLAAPLLLPQKDWNRTTREGQQATERSLAERRADPFGLETLADPERRAQALAASAARIPPFVAAGSFSEHRMALYPGPINRNEDAAGFAGTVTLFLALLVFALPRPPNPSIGRAFPAALALGAAVIVVHPPGLSYLLNALPLLEPSVTSHRRVAVLLTLGLAGLAACAVDRMGPTFEQKGRLTFTALGLGAALAAVLLWASPTGIPWLQLGALAFGLIGLLALPSRWRAPGLGLVIAAELLVLHMPANPPMPRDLYYPTKPVIAALQQAGEDHPTGRIAARRGVLLPRMASIYGVSDVRTGRVGPSLYQGLTGFLGAPPTAPQAPLFEDPRLDLLGVRWWLTGPKATVPGRLLFEDATARLWERPRPLDRLFLPVAVEIHRDGSWENRIGQLDPRETALVGAAVSPIAWRADQQEASSVRLEVLHDDALFAEADLAERRLVASSIYQDGGWRLLVDGQPHPTLLANGPLLATWLPAGQRSLRFIYRPATFVLGAFGAGLALTLMALWVGAPALPGRSSARRHPGPVAPDGASAGAPETGPIDP